MFQNVKKMYQNETKNNTNVRKCTKNNLKMSPIAVKNISEFNSKMIEIEEIILSIIDILIKEHQKYTYKGG